MRHSRSEPAYVAQPEPDGRRRRWGYFAAIAAFAIVAGPAAYLLWLLHGVQFPSVAQVTSRRVIVLEAADGQPLSHNGFLRLPPVGMTAMSPRVINAVLSIEDRRFYQHGAIDLRSTLRALEQNLIAGRIVAGGSTITQQLAKTLFLTPARTYTRKLKEAAIAIWMEHELTKNQILTAYLNNVYLGSGATGFPAAAKLYFGKSVGKLTLPEAAMLAGMISAPNEDDPLVNLAAARARAATVLDAMVANGKLSPQAALVAKLHPATPSPQSTSPSSAGWFADWAYNKLAHATPSISGTMRVRTTLDLRLQKLASSLIKSTPATYGAQKHATEAALVAMKPDGAVVAMVGGRSYGESKYNRAVQALRQPGSAFKLFDYYAALRQGFTPTDEVLDAPIDVKGWKPQNYGRRFHGEVTLATAFAHSFNAATVRLSQEVGINNVIAAARDLGLRAALKNDPSLALGTSGVSLLNLTSAYAAVRAGVTPIVPWAIASVRVAGQKRALPVGPPDQPQHSLGQYQAELTGLLQGVVQRGTGRAAALPGLAAGKTGTTQDYRDAWFIGFDKLLVVGVWVGNDDYSPMRRVVGGSLPAAIWKRFMEGASAPSAPVIPVIATAQPPQNPGMPLDRTANAAAPAYNAAAQACNIPVCQQFYRSFRPSDCTYQPYGGGARRYCDRGQGETTAGMPRRETPVPPPPPVAYDLFSPYSEARRGD